MACRHGSPKTGIAGLPKQKEFFGPWLMMLHGLFFCNQASEARSTWRRDDVKGEEENFKGMFILPRC